MNPKLWALQFQGKTVYGKSFTAEISLQLIALAAEKGMDLNRFIAAELAGYNPDIFHVTKLHYIEA